MAQLDLTQHSKPQHTPSAPKVDNVMKALELLKSSDPASESKLEKMLANAMAKKDSAKGSVGEKRTAENLNPMSKRCATTEKKMKKAESLPGSST